MSACGGRVENTLLERETEVSTLERAFDDLADGCGGVVVIEAASGVGKTTLLRHARHLAEAAGSVVLTARGAELERDFTFGVVRQLFEPALPRHGPARQGLFTGAAIATETLFGTPDSAAPVSERPRAVPGSLYPLLNGLYWLLVNLAEPAPVVLLVDDVQWIDLPSLRFLGFLARRLDSVAVTVIMTSRPAEHHEDGLLDEVLAADRATLLEPKDLSESGVAELVRRALGQDAAPEFCVTCHAVTHGNPLFVRELLRILVSNGTHPDAAAAASVEAAGPDALRRHLISRLRRLPSDARRVARAVSVLGDDADLGLVARQCDLTLPRAASAAEQLTHCGILDRADPPAFIHAVVREVVSSLIPLAERSGEHERAADVLTEAGLPAVRIASHLLRTSPAANAARVDVLLAAANQARKQGSPSCAAVFLRRALREPPPIALRSELNRLLGNCLAHQLALPEAEQHLREALSLAGSSVARSLCAYSLARFRNACGAPGEAVELLTTAIKELPLDEHAELAAELEAEMLGVARTDLNRRSQLVDQLDSFRRRPGFSTAVADAQLSVESVFSGDTVDDAVTLARRALAGDLLAPDRSAVWAAIHTLVVADRLDEAERYLNRALGSAVAQGLLLPTALAHGYLARVAFLRGDLAAAKEHVELGEDGLRDPHFALPVLHATHVDLLVEDDEARDADMVLQRGVLAEGDEPRTVLQLWLLGARSRLRVAQGRASAALEDAMTCQRLYRQWGAARMPDVPWRLHAAQACTSLGERERAVELVAEELRVARSFGVPRHVALALRAGSALAATAVERRRLLGESIALLETSPARLELARTLEMLGGLLLDGGDRTEGRRIVGRAAELAWECHAPAMTRRLDTVLTGNSTRARRPHLTGIHAFTPSERRIAELAGTGLTNRQIAERLFLSEKTVEAHLSRAYRKLGIRTRTELAVRMAVGD